VVYWDVLNSIKDAYSPRIRFNIFGKKPSKAHLPGLEIVVWPRPPHKAWACCLDGLLSN
jgi:hypothetical protein